MSLTTKLKKKIQKKFFNFTPYKKKMSVKGIEASFFFATEQAKEWYDPIKPYAKLEYEWVLDNVELKNKNIIDCGSHHGQYSVVLGLGAGNNCNLISVDPIAMNCTLTEINLLLNGITPQIVQCAITTSEKIINFSNQSNGFISNNGSLSVQGRKLSSIMPNAEVVKLDIEGHEFEMLNQALNEMDNVQTWIIEVHPHTGKNPDDLIKMLLNKRYKIYWVNRQLNKVEPYILNTTWHIHSTIFAVLN
jgi:FkbM family methyltransferase